MPTANLILLVDPTKQQLADYANAVAKVNNYAYSITQTSLPSLSNIAPDYYANFAQEFSPAKAHAIYWTGSLFPNMLALPKIIIGAQNLFNLEKMEFEQYIHILQKDPNNEEAKNGLNEILSEMQNIIQGQISSCEDIEKNLEEFANYIKNDAETLNDIAKKALQAAGEDQEKIKMLNQHIDDLQTEINNLNTWLTISGIGMGVSLFVGAVGLVVAFIPGFQVVGGVIIVAAVIGEAASITGTVISSIKIQAAHHQIQADRKEISERKQDIIVLQAVNKQFEYLVKANEEAQTALTTIKTMWKNLDSDITVVINELTTIDTDVTSADYAKALIDMQEVNVAWNEVMTFAKALAKIDYKWQDKDGNWHNMRTAPPKADRPMVTLLNKAA